MCEGWNTRWEVWDEFSKIFLQKVFQLLLFNDICYNHVMYKGNKIRKSFADSLQRKYARDNFLAIGNLGTEQGGYFSSENSYGKFCDSYEIIQCQF